MTLKYLIQKGFLQIRRNPFLPRLIFIFPVIIMCVMPWVMNMEIKNIVVDVVDHDHSTLSAQLVHRIEASHYFIFHGQKNGYGDALEDVERSAADVIVEIPQHFERDRQRGEHPQILVAANAVNGTKGSMGSQYMNSIISQQLASWSSTGSVGAKSVASAESLVSVLYLYNKHLNYKLFMIPSLIAILIMLMCGFLPALNILGLVISNYNETMQQAVFVMWFIVVCLMLLSGLFTPVRSMPHWAYLTTYVNPMHYFIDGIRTVFVRGGDFASIAHQVLALGIIATLMNAWAVYSYRKNS